MQKYTYASRTFMQFLNTSVSVLYSRNFLEKAVKIILQQNFKATIKDTVTISNDNFVLEIGENISIENPIESGKRIFMNYKLIYFAPY